MSRSAQRFALTTIGLALLFAGGLKVLILGGLSVLGLFSRALLTGLTVAAALAVLAAVRATARRRVGGPRVSGRARPTT